MPTHKVESYRWLVMTYVNNREPGWQPSIDCHSEQEAKNRAQELSDLTGHNTMVLRKILIITPESPLRE